MSVAERMGCMASGDGPGDFSPVGMRVLAVDDDPTCLKLLERLLLHCQYHVTTSNQAITALKLLRENKGQFDLVITDVHMPDMDGFKLLELIGLEMNLPVIMLSANGEFETVNRGITHGACDYLLKPVRIEELKNIWQHVMRRRKCYTRDENNFDDGEDCDKAEIGNSEGGQAPASNGVSDCNGKLSRKRKDQDEEDEDDCDENMNENEDPSAQKKPRVVWSVDLHRKFVAAVNLLGIDKAVPKKILDLMNVERLTRENVASHLQKYRLYLKRISVMASQQANMAASFRGRNPSYLPMGSLEGFRNFHSLMRSRQLPSVTPFQSNGVLGRMNSPSGFGQQMFVPSGTVQHGLIHNTTNNHINDLRKLQGSGLVGHSHGSSLQGMPMSLDIDRLQQQKTVVEANNRFAGGFSGAGLAIGSSSNSFANMTNNPLLLHSSQQHTLSGVLGSHSDVRIPSLSSDPFKIGLRESSHLPDISRCNDTWQGAVPSTNYSAKNLSMAAPSSHDPSNSLNNVTPIISQRDSNHHEVSSSSLAMVPQHDPVVGKDVQHPGSSLGGSTMLTITSVDESSKFLSDSEQNLEEQKQNHACLPNPMFGSSLNSSLPNLHMIDPIADNPTMNNGFPNEKMDMTLIGPNSGAPYLAQNYKTDFLLNYKEEFILETTKIHSGFSSNACSFDDLVNAINKPDHRDDVNFFDGDIVGDIYSMGTCM